MLRVRAAVATAGQLVYKRRRSWLVDQQPTTNAAATAVANRVRIAIGENRRLPAFRRASRSSNVAVFACERGDGAKLKRLFVIRIIADLKI